MARPHGRRTAWASGSPPSGPVSYTHLPYIEALSAIRLGLTAPHLVEEAIPDASGIAEGFDRYRAALAESGAVDFDEQIYGALEILLTDPQARAAAQAKCRYLLVDEFQDLTPAHLLLIRLLTASAYDLSLIHISHPTVLDGSLPTPP